MFRTRRPTPWIPVLVSFALHGALLGSLIALPAPPETRPERLIVETCRLWLADAPAPPAASAKQPTPQLDAPFEPILLPPRGSSLSEKLLGPTSIPVVAALHPRGATGAMGSTGSSVGPARPHAPSLFGPVAPGQRVVYAIDHSVSMGWRQALTHARRDLLAALSRLPASARFQIIAYNRQAEPLRIGGSIDYLAATPEVLQQVGAALEGLKAEGGTDHARAVRRALLLQPDVVYLVTDADDLDLTEVQRIRQLNRRQTIVHTVELSARRQPRADSPLQLLAQVNRGTFRRVALPE